MNDKTIAYCGLICSECPAYVATQADDWEALERTAAQWRKQFNEPSITADSVVCDGCLTTDGRVSGYCSTCQIRFCARERNVVNCAHCDDYGCEKLAGFLAEVEVARQLLDEIRRGLV